MVFVFLMLGKDFFSLLQNLSINENKIIAFIITEVFSVLDIFRKYESLTGGLFDPSVVFYYISIMALFLFLTVRVFEKRRWS